MMNKKREFSKILLIQQSFLIWIVTLVGLYLAYYSVVNQTYSDLPWIATIIACPWTAYGATQAFYYKKSEKENTKDGIKFESVMAQLREVEREYEYQIVSDDNEEACG